MHAFVKETRRLTPGLVRITLAGGTIAAFAMPDDTDAYVNVAIPPEGAPYGPIFDVDEISEMEREVRPARRRYTVRTWDDEAKELVLDFVVHGDAGVAGPWAARAEVGDVLVFSGPGSGYRPDPAADWHLMLGDESALPAIAASLEALGEGDRAIVRLVCDGPEHELELASPGLVDVQWLHRTGDGERDAALLLEATRALTFPDGRVHAFVHGEADEIRGLRRHLLAERGLTRADMSCSPYWRRDMTDEAWRTIKRDYVAAMEQDV